MAEAIGNINVQPCFIEHPMYKIFKLRAADVQELIAGDYFHICQKESRVFGSISYTFLDGTPSYANLVKQIPLVLNRWVCLLYTSPSPRDRG